MSKLIATKPITKHYSISSAAVQIAIISHLEQAFQHSDYYNMVFTSNIKQLLELTEL